MNHINMTTNSFNSVSNIDNSHNEDYLNMDNNNYNADVLYAEQADQQTASDDSAVVATATVLPPLTVLASSSSAPVSSASALPLTGSDAGTTYDGVDYSNDGTGVEDDRLTDINIDDPAEVLDKPSSDKLSIIRNSDAGLFDDDYADEDAERYHRGHRQRGGGGHQGSGFGSDVEEEEDDDDEVPAPNRRKYSHGHHRGGSANHKTSRVRDEAAYRESDSFKKVPNKYANSDSIKVISTPHGKVSIVYQSATPSNATAKGDATRKQLPMFVESNSRQPTQTQQKITPVLTPDGKVALLYRGASDLSTNNKYEPIVNVPATKTVDVAATNSSGSSIGIVTAVNTPPSVNQTAFVNETVIVTTTSKPIPMETTVTEAPSYVNTLPPAESPRRNSNEEENVILPNINRPPSEVLGIKKNQFIQFRITDGVVTDTPPIGGINQASLPLDRVIIQPDQIVPNQEYDYDSSATNDNDGPLPNEPIDQQTDRTTSTKISEILAKTEVVNLAIIPSFDNSMKTNRINQIKAIENHNRQNHAQVEHNNNEENEIVFDISSHQIQNGRTDNNNNNNNNDNNNNANMLNDKHRLHHHRHPHLAERDLTAIHCAMQAMVAIAAISTVIGMLGAYIKQRVFDQITSMH